MTISYMKPSGCLQGHHSPNLPLYILWISIKITTHYDIYYFFPYSFSVKKSLQIIYALDTTKSVSFDTSPMSPTPSSSLSHSALAVYLIVPQYRTYHVAF